MGRMFSFIRRIFRKKKVRVYVEKEVDPFFVDRPYSVMRLHEYWSYRYDDNDFYRLYYDMGLVAFVNPLNKADFKNYLDINSDSINAIMESKGRYLLKSLRELETPEDLNLLYYFPFLPETSLKYLENHYIRIDAFIGFKDITTAGFLSFTPFGIVFLGKKEDETFEEFINQYLDNLKHIDYYKTRRQIFYSLGEENEDEEPDIELDEETQSILNTIENNLIKLKESGQFFIVAPKLEILISKVSKNYNPDSGIILSEMVIDKDFKITLPEYDNIEIVLSHLTKAVYILFLNHPEGILVTELKNYEQELLSIYKNISYQVSLDKMINTVKELVENDKAIFVHFSRIKSAFVKKFTNYYAQYYYIQGYKGKAKFIKLPREKLLCSLQRCKH